MTDTIHINRDGKLTLKTGGIINDSELFKLDDIIMTNRNIKFTEALLRELRRYVNRNSNGISDLKQKYGYLYESYNTQIQRYNEHMNKLKQKYINKLKQSLDTTRRDPDLTSEPEQILDTRRYPDLTSGPEQSLDTTIIDPDLDTTVKDPDLDLGRSEYGHKMFYLEDI